MKIAIYPGHVGKDSGAIDGREHGDNYYSIEAVITYAISRKMFEYCQDTGLEPILADGDFYTRIAETAQCNLGVSIHCDAFRNQKVSGYHCIYRHGNAEAKRLAGIIDSHMSVISDRARSPHSRTNLAILNRTNKNYPVVLVETGFLTNTEDEGRLRQRTCQNSIAFAIVAAIREYIYNH